jgi:hypothetical protein
MKGARKDSHAVHPGITMHKLPVGGGFVGLVFAIGSVTIFLIALPSLSYFVALALLLGLGVAALLRFARRSTESFSISRNLQK